MNNFVIEIANEPTARKIFMELRIIPKFVAWHDLAFTVEWSKELQTKLDEYEVCYKVSRV